MDTQFKPNLNHIPTLFAMLDKLYDKEEKLKLEMQKLTLLYKQLQDDKEMVQTLIMYQSNKKSRG